MSSLLDHYRVLGVGVGACMADVTSSYKRLCRLYHPDINSDPESEELMKKINIAYTVLREKLKREAAYRERASYARPVRRHSPPETRPAAPETRKTAAESEKEAYSVIHGYFKAISAYDYSAAYDYLSAYDKRHVSRESFIEWRTSVARLYPMREFTVESKSTEAKITFNDDKTLQARKYRVMVTEENFTEKTTSSGDVEKLVINEHGQWRIFLGYRGLYELTRTFDERFEAGRKRDYAKRFEEYYDALHPEYNMLSLSGMRKEASREMYRQKRYGGTLTFAVISIKAGGARAAWHDEILRSAAGTINGVLRETDIPAYVGDGVFAILFVELKKKNAEEIVGGLADKIRTNAELKLGALPSVEYTYASWSGGSFADMNELNKVLGKFSKKL